MAREMEEARFHLREINHPGRQGLTLADADAVAVAVAAERDSIAAFATELDSIPHGSAFNHHP